MLSTLRTCRVWPSASSRTPQAAFYAWIERHKDWRERVRIGDLILVVDIGGDTTDFTLIAVTEQAGELTLELDDGQVRHLKAGDIVIQNGTRHAWRNSSAQPAVMAAILIGADRK